MHPLFCAFCRVGKHSHIKVLPCGNNLICFLTGQKHFSLYFLFFSLWNNDSGNVLVLTHLYENHRNRFYQNSSTSGFGGDGVWGWVWDQTFLVVLWKILGRWAGKIKCLKPLPDLKHHQTLLLWGFWWKFQLQPLPASHSPICQDLITELLLLLLPVLSLGREVDKVYFLGWFDAVLLWLQYLKAEFIHIYRTNVLHRSCSIFSQISLQGIPWGAAVQVLTCSLFCAFTQCRDHLWVGTTADPSILLSGKLWKSNFFICRDRKILCVLFRSAWRILGFSQLLK